MLKRWWAERDTGLCVKEMVGRERYWSLCKRDGGQREILVSVLKRWWAERDTGLCVKEMVGIHRDSPLYQTVGGQREILATLPKNWWRDIDFFFFFFFAFPSYISGVHHFWVRFLRM